MPPRESWVDVFIIGAGPAGLMCANALALAGINVRIIDKRPFKITAGHADGIQPRSLEVLQSYGLANRLLREGNVLYALATYNPGHNGRIELMRRVPAVAPSIRSPYPFFVTLHQGGVESILIDSMKERGVEVERPRIPVGIEISDDVDELSSLSSYPVKLTVEHLDLTNEESKIEIVHAKFVLGADGAHSWVRSALGIEMEGEQTDYIWGVIDMVETETDFPDIRNATAIHSEHGSSLTIPREDDKVRFYVQLSDMDVMDPLTGRVDKNRVTPEKLVSVLKKILHPFVMADPKEIEWWTVYIIGQRVASRYSANDRIFIAGDACHTHSPKAGQGMNASMQDTHNFAWKLAQVIRGWSSPSLLKTYEYERRKFAQDLINFDKEFAALYSKKLKTEEDAEGVTDEQFFNAFQIHAEIMSGTGIQYSPCTIVEPKHQKCAKNVAIGRRMPPQIFVRTADMCPVEIQDLLPADIRFKVLLFVGNLTETRIAELDSLAEELRKPSSFLQKYSFDGNPATVFDIITIALGKKEEANYLLIPKFFRPHWRKVLLDDIDVTGSKGGDGYENYGIDSNYVTLVIVRPDSFVGTIALSTAIADLDDYFGSFMIPRKLDA